jgi:GH15 family glucan-1,4-alpha-glucosidase
MRSASRLLHSVGFTFPGLETAKMDNLDYGIIGNGRSCALVSRTGSIDWCCLADFDSPSVFGALLDAERGGRFAIVPEGQGWRIEQSYLKHTNILCTHFTAPDVAFDVIDFMPCYRSASGEQHYPPDIIRMIVPVKGIAAVRVYYEPRLDYGGQPTRLTQSSRYLKAETTGEAHESIYLYSNCSYRAISGHEPIAIGEPRYFLVAYDQKIGSLDQEHMELDLQLTKAYWMAWSSRTARSHLHDEALTRSALVLKLLSYRPTGAVLAAATTSLPEAIGEQRNWDYRFCWVRDASMTMRTLVNIRHPEVARRFFHFLLDVVEYKNPRIHVIYPIRGQTRLEESQLDWLAGYANSRPVRIGNAASVQRQNDIYGTLLDAIYHGFVLFKHQSHRLEALTRGIVRHIEAHWREPDQGIWEIRGTPQHFTYSKIMCWVGIDRAIRIAELIGMHEFAAEYASLRDLIRDDVMTHGFNVGRKAFCQAYGSEHLDAALLLSCRLGFVGANDERWISTVTAIYRDLCRDGLMYRYRTSDDFGTPVSSFTTCTFWMIQALHGIGEKKLALDLFDNLLKHANHVGLFSEDLDFATHRLLGNFPQAYSHLALIDTILALNGVHLPTDTLPERLV